MPSKKWKFETRELNRLREELRHEIRRQFAEMEESIMDQLRVMLSNPNTWATSGAPVFIPNGQAIDAISQYSQGLVPAAIAQGGDGDFPAFRQESHKNISPHHTPEMAEDSSAEETIQASNAVKTGLNSLSEKERAVFEAAWNSVFEGQGAEIVESPEEVRAADKSSPLSGPKKLRGDADRM